MNKKIVILIFLSIIFIFNGLYGSVSSGETTFNYTHSGGYGFDFSEQLQHDIPPTWSEYNNLDKVDFGYEDGYVAASPTIDVNNLCGHESGLCFGEIIDMGVITQAEFDAITEAPAGGYSKTYFEMDINKVFILKTQEGHYAKVQITEEVQTESGIGEYLKFQWVYQSDGSRSFVAGTDVDPPFGSFDTPINGSTVSSSIPVTGWALDDIGVESVKIYRGNTGSLVYIGDAMLVEGARPDVAAQYPEYPNNTKAGWGYMMLTNFLPDGGNGTFTLHSIATDYNGRATTLGTKTILCDNANAVKPFGAIDTPSQGGTVSGSSFVNWGWALTPQPNHIPTNGSTLNVFVDSVNLGHPTYNIYRSDIATLFPGYANSDGAIGYFSLDTTAYENGVHTIYWTATDNAGNIDGIGSRYFTIQNTSSSSSVNKIAGNNKRKPIIKIEEFSNLPFNYFEPIKMKKGYGRNIQSKIIQADEENIFRIEIRELERIELQLSNVKAGYMLAGNRIYPLPLGSTLDTKNGTFNWIPGPGFYGNYRLVFVVKDQNGDLSKREILVNIVQKFGLKK